MTNEMNVQGFFRPEDPRLGMTGCGSFRAGPIPGDLNWLRVAPLFVIQIRRGQIKRGVASFDDVFVVGHLVRTVRGSGWLINDNRHLKEEHSTARYRRRF